MTYASHPSFCFCYSNITYFPYWIQKQWIFTVYSIPWRNILLGSQLNQLNCVFFDIAPKPIDLRLNSREKTWFQMNFQPFHYVMINHYFYLWAIPFGTPTLRTSILIHIYTYSPPLPLDPEARTEEKQKRNNSIEQTAISFKTLNPRINKRRKVSNNQKFVKSS